MKYSKAMVEKICGYIRLGMKNEDASIAAGIDETTFYDWKKNKPQFSQSLKRAEIDGMVSNLAVIQKNKTKHWQAAGWLLERRHPDTFSLRHEISGPRGGAIPIKQTRSDMTGVDTKTLNALLAHLEKRKAPSADKGD